MRKRTTTLKKVSAKTISLILIIIFFVTISVGYSYLKQTLIIAGKSTIVKKESSGDYVDGESTYSWEITNEWTQGGSTEWACDIDLTVVNMDEDIKVWEIAFDIPEEFNEQKTNFWIASSVTYENGRLTLVGFDYEPLFEKGTSRTLKFHLIFDQQVDMFIENLTLNGYRASS